MVFYQTQDICALDLASGCVLSLCRGYYYFSKLGSGVIYFRGSDEPERQELTQQDILPAQGVAVLQLSDGREVPLNSTTIIQEQEGVVIKNDSSHVLDYTLATAKSEPLYNTITVPAGGEFRVLLSDGSSVCLNSCSALTYPVPFTGDVREVKLTGEAYFDVRNRINLSS